MLRTTLLLLFLIAASAMASETAVVVIEIADMSCPACARTVTQHLQKVPGAITADVSLRNKRATVVVATDAEVDIAKLKQAITDAGFKPGNALVEGRR